MITHVDTPIAALTSTTLTQDLVWEKKNGFPEVQVATVSDKRRPRGKAPSLYDGPGCWGVSGPCEAGIFSGLEARG